jgi:hypothetical protein
MPELKGIRFAVLTLTRLQLSISLRERGSGTSLNRQRTLEFRESSQEP